jgi:hypothetical protein
MQKTRILLLVLIMAAVTGAALVTAGESSDEQMCIPMGKITLSAPESVEAKRSAVEFPHAVHFNYDCASCHHDWTGEEKIESCTTSGCHELTSSPKKAGSTEFEGEPEILYFKNAFHSLCIGCHQDIKASNKELELAKGVLPAQLPKTGPTGCIECHPQE